MSEGAPYFDVAYGVRVASSQRKLSDVCSKPLNFLTVFKLVNCSALELIRRNAAIMETSPYRTPLISCSLSTTTGIPIYGGEVAGSSAM